APSSISGDRLTSSYWSITSTSTPNLLSHWSGLDTAVYIPIGLPPILPNVVPRRRVTAAPPPPPPRAARSGGRSGPAPPPPQACPPCLDISDRRWRKVPTGRVYPAPP